MLNGSRDVIICIENHTDIGIKKHMQNFVFLTTQGCHLCEVAEALLVAGLNLERHQVDVIDIAYDDALLECYGERIPVLKNEDTKAELSWPFDAMQLERFVALEV